MNVVIDGIIYAPVSEVIINRENLLIALLSGYWTHETICSTTDKWRKDQANNLFISVVDEAHEQFDKDVLTINQFIDKVAVMFAEEK